MIDSTIIDISLSLIFVYTTLSLICLTITEVVTRVLKSREQIFNVTFGNLIKYVTGNDEADKCFKAKMKKVLGAGLDIAEKKDKTDKQGEIKSYKKLSSKHLAFALFDVLRESVQGTSLKLAGNKEKGQSASFRGDPFMLSLMTGLDTLIGKSGIEKINKKKDEILKNIENLVDSVMDKISETYRKRAEFFTILIASIVVVMNNADTLQMTLALRSESFKREVLVNAAVQIAEKNINIETLNNTNKKEGTTPQQTNKSTSTPDAKKSDRDVITQYLADIQLSNLPFGPRSWLSDFKNIDSCGTFFCWLFLKIIGLTATIALVSLGAPFWLDTLKKVAAIKKTKTNLV